MKEKLISKINNSPAVAILGARQCGKTTLAKNILSNFKSVYLDLQKKSDLNKLKEPEIFFEKHRDELICLDEIQLVPELFSYLRSEIDEYRKNGRFLILGSASRDLIKQSGETLAGRISYTDLTPLLYNEVKSEFGWQEHLLRGGFPNSLLAADNIISYEWREDFIRTFLERDIPKLGFSIPVPIMDKLWRLLSHYHGQEINYSKIAGVIDASKQTVKKYISILEQTYMIRLLQPYEANLKKRLVKSPQVYIRDSGILHSLLGIEIFDDLLAHPSLGASWEGYAIENITAAHPGYKPYFIKTSNGAEVDLILEKGMQRKIYEFKFSKSPSPSRGFYEIINDLKAENEPVYIVAPVDDTYEYKKNIFVTNI
jgi:predicted AAA+ superfamily ATPase